jgi:hypothetical protein
VELANAQPSTVSVIQPILVGKTFHGISDIQIGQFSQDPVTSDWRAAISAKRGQQSLQANLSIPHCIAFLDFPDKRWSQANINQVKHAIAKILHSWN